MMTRKPQFRNVPEGESTPLIDHLEELDVSGDVYNWIGECETLEEAWVISPESAWMLELAASMIGQAGWPTHEEVVLSACDCIEISLTRSRIVTPKSPPVPTPITARDAVNTVRNWAHNKSAFCEEVKRTKGSLVAVNQQVYHVIKTVREAGFYDSHCRTLQAYKCSLEAALAAVRMTGEIGSGHYVDQESAIRHSGYRVVFDSAMAFAHTLDMPEEEGMQQAFVTLAILIRARLNPGLLPERNK